MPISIDTGGDAKQLQRIEDALKEQAVMLQNILDEMGKSEAEIQQAVSEIEDAIDRAAYNDAVRILDHDVAVIQSLQDRLTAKTALAPDPQDRADALHLRDNILSAAAPSANAIHNSMMGAAAADGVYSLRSRISFRHSGSVTEYAPS